MDVQKKELELILEETRAMYLEVNENSKSLDEKALSIITGSTIILTLFSALQSLFSILDINFLFLDFMEVIIILFIIMLILLIYAISPRKYRMVFEADWEKIENGILIHKTIDDVYRQLISNYIDRIKINSELNRKKSKLIIYASLIFSIIIAALIIASI